MADIDPKAGEEPVMTVEYKASASSEKKAKKRAAQFDRDIRSGKLKRQTNTALDGIIRLAAYKLYRMDLDTHADRLLKEWNEQYRFYLDETRCEGITCHEPLSQWLAEQCLLLEILLGKDVVHALRIDDLITINYSLKVLFSCPAGMTESDFFLHMVEDPGHGYRGLMPVVTYWLAEIGCVGASWGSGFLFCAPLAMAAEIAVKLVVAPKLSEIVYGWSCKSP